MRFAILGADTESIELASAAKSMGHSLLWCGDLAEFGHFSAEWGLEDEGHLWEGLLEGDALDGVILGRGSTDPDLRTEQLNQLTKSQVPVLTTFPLVDSVLAYYEVDMSRGESGAVLRHFNPLIEQQALVQQCDQWITDGHPELGSIEQVVWERPLAERTQQNVLWHFSRDVEFLALIAGGLNRLGALGSPDQAATYAGLSVQLLGRREVPVRWQVGPIEQDDHPRLVLIAQNGKLTVEFDENSRPIKLVASPAGENQTAELESADASQSSIQRFIDAFSSPAGDQTSSWSRALAAMELTDTIEIALRRGRMIEVHQQQLTEQMAFKGTMSAVGCGVLLIIPPIVLLLGWIAGEMGLSISKYWPHALLAMLGLFLGFQLIPKLLFKADE